MLCRFVSYDQYIHHTQYADSSVKELATRDKCRATATFIENEFSKLSEDINEKRDKMRQKNAQDTQDAKDTQDTDDSWKLTFNVSIRPWNPTEEREADLGEM